MREKLLHFDAASSSGILLLAWSKYVNSFATVAGSGNWSPKAYRSAAPFSTYGHGEFLYLVIPWQSQNMIYLDYELSTPSCDGNLFGTAISSLCEFHQSIQPSKANWNLFIDLVRSLNRELVMPQYQFASDWVTHLLPITASGQTSIDRIVRVQLSMCLCNQLRTSWSYA